MVLKYINRKGNCRLIELNNVSFAYIGASTPVLHNLNLSIEDGSFVALCGHNGSGKSTIARLLNGLLLPDRGKVLVNGLSTLEKKSIFEIRKQVGLVFQNPDNQTVATIVEDDVAFGPENIGIPRKEIRERVDWALSVVGMSEYAKGTHTRLSGGQKQRVAIASVLALRPKIIVLDESTSMLDPKGRDEVLKVVQQLNKEHGITVVMITHFMEEAYLADRIIVLSKGKIVLDGGKEIYQERTILEQAGLELPPFAYIADELGLKNIQSEDELVNKICETNNISKNISSTSDTNNSLKNTYINQTNEIAQTNSTNQINNNQNDSFSSQNNFEKNSNDDGALGGFKTDDASRTLQIHSKGLKHTYSIKTSFQKVAIQDIDIDVYEGDFLGIIGHTGSGKTTFIGHLNALVKLQQGELVVCGIDLNKKFKPNDLRSRVGMVFQYPEYQLFDETVAKDVGFGPKNLGLEPSEIDRRVREAIRLVGLDYDKIASKSPFELSGGQKRRVALAGVIAMRPKVLVLDEPTAGLDPQGKKEILDLIVSIKHYCPTVIMISHNMDEIAQYCNKVALFSQSKLVKLESPQKLFQDVGLLKELRLDIPSTTRIISKLNNKGMNVDRTIMSMDGLIDVLKV